MRALYFNGDVARVESVAEPEAFPDSALVRVSLAGVCDTDLQLVKGYMGFRGVLGHEFVGRVCEGPDELLDQRVVGEINFACRSCALCKTGLERHCPNRRVMGILDADGAFAEYVRVPLANLHRVPESVSDEAAVFVEPLAAAFEILEQVDVEVGSDCLVLGDGKLGLLIAQVLRSAGARVRLVGKHAEKLATARRLGIDAVALDDFEPDPMSLVVEATGRRDGFERAIAAVKPRGSIVLKTTVAARAEVDLAPLVINEIQVIGSRCGPFPPAIRALEDGSVDVGSLIRERVRLADALEGLRIAAMPGALKVLIEAD